MDWAIGISMVITLLVISHLLLLSFPSESHLDEIHEDDKKIDLR